MIMTNSSTNAENVWKIGREDAREEIVKTEGVGGDDAGFAIFQHNMAKVMNHVSDEAYGRLEVSAWRQMSEKFVCSKFSKSMENLCIFSYFLGPFLCS